MMFYYHQIHSMSVGVYSACRYIFFEKKKNTVFALAPHVYTLTQLAFYYFTFNMEKNGRNEI